MCVRNPKPFHSDLSIIAYKVMLGSPSQSLLGENFVMSQMSHDEYVLGKEYTATYPKRPTSVAFSLSYAVGFHAYEKFEDAKRLCQFPYAVVRVELSDLTFSGIEIYEDEQSIGGTKSLYIPTYVANKCKFLEIVFHNWEDSSYWTDQKSWLPSSVLPTSNPIPTTIPLSSIISSDMA